MGKIKYPNFIIIDYHYQCHDGNQHKCDKLKSLVHIYTICDFLELVVLAVNGTSLAKLVSYLILIDHL